MHREVTADAALTLKPVPSITVRTARWTEAHTHKTKASVCINTSTYSVAFPADTDASREQACITRRYRMYRTLDC